jgi:hypothetical protein
MNCPKCKNECSREYVDNEVAIQYGPYGCENCGWSEDEEYDLSEGKSRIDKHGGVIDQWGCYYPSDTLEARVYKFIQTHPWVS